MDTRLLISVLSLAVLQTHSLIQEFTLQYQKSSTKHRVLRQWESNSSCYRTDAFTIRTWYDSCYNSSRTYIIQHTVLRMWNHLHCTFSISNDLPLPDSDAKAEGKKEGLIASLKHTHFSVESIAMIIIGFTCTGTFQLWLNCAQNFAKENVGWADPSVMQSYYSAGTMIALIVTALLTRKIKDVRFILVYPVICLATMVVVLVGQTKPLMIAGAFIIGWQEQADFYRS